MFDVYLPKGHKSDFTVSADGTVIVRISGPNAHVKGESKDVDEAVQAAFEWFEQVGGEL